MLFYIFRIGTGGWREPDNFVIAVLHFIKFSYWYGKRCTQCFTRYFLNQIQENYIELCLFKMFLKPVFIIYQTVHVFISWRKLRLKGKIKGDHSKLYKQLNSRSSGHKFICDNPTICGLTFAWNRFRSFVQNIFLKPLLFYAISQAWSRNDWLLLYWRRFQFVKCLKTHTL